MAETFEDLENAWRRIGKSPDGRIARKLLIQMLLRVDPPDAEAGALLVSNAQRNFASRLITLLDAEIADVERVDDADAKRIHRSPSGYGGGSRRRVPVNG